MPDAPKLHIVTPDFLLLARLASGDAAAGRELRSRYETTTYAIAYTLVADSTLADAAVEQVFRELPVAASADDHRPRSVPSCIAALVRRVLASGRVPDPQAITSLVA